MVYRESSGMTKRPFLAATARAFGILSVLAVVGMVIFVGLAVYSAAQLRPASSAGGQPAISPSGNNTVLVRANVSVSNPGYFSLDDLQIHTLVRLPGSNGSVLATGSSPAVSIASGSEGVVPLVFSVPLSGPSDAILLTHDLVLPGWAWVNATYARVFAIELTIPRNVSWGAPFANLAVEAGTPRAWPNGTVEQPLNVSFSDDSTYPIVGTVHYVIENAAGAECTGGTIPLNVGAHTSFRAGSSVYVPSACGAPGNSVVVSFSGGPWNVGLAKEAFG